MYFVKFQNRNRKDFRRQRKYGLVFINCTKRSSLLIRKQHQMQSAPLERSKRQHKPTRKCANLRPALCGGRARIISLVPPSESSCDYEFCTKCSEHDLPRKGRIYI